MIGTSCKQNNFPILRNSGFYFAEFMRNFSHSITGKLKKKVRTPEFASEKHLFSPSLFDFVGCTSKKVLRVSWLIRILFLASMGIPLVAAQSDALRRIAETGDARAELDYAKAIRKASEEDAREWAQKAADQGLGEAWYWLGYTGLGKEPTAFYYEKAAELGYGPAFPSVLYTGNEVEKGKRFADLARRLKIDLGYSRDRLDLVDRCYDLRTEQIPNNDRPDFLEMAAFRRPDADCTDFREVRDWERYRKCVLAQPDASTSSPSELFSNGWAAASAAEIYANGWGVPRNPRLAGALLCRTGHGDVPGMLNDLRDTEGQSVLIPEFNVCNHIFSTMDGYRCNALSAHLAEKRNDVTLIKIADGLNAPQKQAFNRLREAFSAYQSAEGGRVFQAFIGGTIRNSAASLQEAYVRDHFIADVEMVVEKRTLAMASASESESADSDMNAAYGEDLLRGVAGEKDAGGIGEGYEKAATSAQEAWILYRNAWIDLVVQFGEGAMGTPTDASLSIRTMLARRRIDEIRNNGIGPH
jgi:uncharacterized protein YecT (DUF1311 family)